MEVQVNNWRLFPVWACNRRDVVRWTSIQILLIDIDRYVVANRRSTPRVRL